ncbi:hypothetical protein BKA83DRAFT_4131665 [Pisolithus microcarpus]|nr:hypothetical protein BKA83DRAFT_4131665 [Pisolithus microcarpus]
MSPAPWILSFRLPAMSASSLNQDVPFRPLHELLAEMNISESVTISCAPLASGTEAAPAEPVASIAATCQQKPDGAVKSLAKPAYTHNPPIPHPSHISLPKSNTAVQGYYVIMVGQEVGIFYNWVDVTACTNNISGNTHKQCKSFSEALKVYTQMYNKGCVRAVPIPGGLFWPEAEHSDSSTSCPSSSTSSTEMWSQLGELPVEALTNIL